MRQLLPIFVLITTLTTVAWAQDSAMPQQAHTAHSTSGYGGYEGRAEVFVTGFGLFGHATTANAIGQTESESGGASVGYRFRLNQASALEGRYGFSRDSQKYTIGKTISSIPAYLSEISGSYIYNFPRLGYLLPFLEGGGGVLLFFPGNYGGSTIATGAGAPLNSVYGGTQVYGGSQTGAQTQAKGMFVYGGGVDVPALSHVDIRMEVRGLSFKSPDFGLSALQTNTFSFKYEPAFGFAYRF